MDPDWSRITACLGSVFDDERKRFGTDHRTRYRLYRLNRSFRWYNFALQRDEDYRHRTNETFVGLRDLDVGLQFRAVPALRDCNNAKMFLVNARNFHRGWLDLLRVGERKRMVILSNCCLRGTQKGIGNVLIFLRKFWERGEDYVTEIK